MPRLLTCLALTSIALCAQGCLNTKSLRSARTLDRGRFQFMAAPSVTLLNVLGPNQSFDGPSILTPRPPIRLVPGVDLAARYGVTDSLELGAMFGTSGATASVKFQLKRTDHFALAVGPGLSIGYWQTRTGDIGSYETPLILEVPLLIGLTVGDGHELVIAPRVALEANLNPYRTEFAFQGGASFGVLLRPLPWFHVMPELSLAYPIPIDPSGYYRPTRGPLVQAAVGVMFGGG